ncbi:MAG: hypothetical protein JW388_0027 [Nitrospira sp.]|nr:hypothetical protein [Nitrospira sp.]
MMYPSLLACALCLMAATAFAHGTKQHVLGTVTAVDAVHLTIKMPKGQTVDVRVNKQTRFKEKSNPRNTKMPSVGDRVVIDVTKDDTILTATEVHYASGKSMPSSTQPGPTQAK